VVRLKHRLDHSRTDDQGLVHGSVGERLAALGNDPRYLYPGSDEGRAAVIAYLNSIIAQTRPVMPKISRLNVKAPVVAKAVPIDIQDGAPLGPERSMVRDLRSTTSISKACRVGPNIRCRH